MLIANAQIGHAKSPVKLSQHSLLCRSRARHRVEYDATQASTTATPLQLVSSKQQGGESSFTSAQVPSASAAPVGQAAQATHRMICSNRSLLQPSTSSPPSPLNAMSCTASGRFHLTTKVTDRRAEISAIAHTCSRAWLSSAAMRCPGLPCSNRQTTCA